MTPDPAETHRRTWRDQPKGLACVIIAAFLVLTTFAFGIVIVAIVLAIR